MKLSFNIQFLCDHNRREEELSQAGQSAPTSSSGSLGKQKGAKIKDLVEYHSLWAASEPVDDKQIHAKDQSLAARILFMMSADIWPISVKWADI